MQLRRGPRDRATWTLLYFPLQIYPRWTKLFPFGLPLFPCQLKRCVSGNPQMSTVALCRIGVDNTRSPPHCIICGEFLGKALQRPCSHFVHSQLLGFPCPACMKHATDTLLQPSAVLHCPLVQVRTLAFVWACKSYAYTPPCRTLDVATCIMHTASASATTTPVAPLAVLVARSLAKPPSLIPLHLTLL